MSKLRSMKREVSKNVLRFPIDMYTTFPGSVIITSYILSENKPKVSQIRKAWKTYKNKGTDFAFDDPEYITKLLKLFNMSGIDESKAAFVQSDFNALIVPYIDGKIMPLREDGIYTRTLQKGKIYPLYKENDIGECNE